MRYCIPPLQALFNSSATMNVYLVMEDSTFVQGNKLCVRRIVEQHNVSILWCFSTSGQNKWEDAEPLPRRQHIPGTWLSILALSIWI